eukprot:13782978-Heterocapsa_arctica.AAC.1
MWSWNYSQGHHLGAADLLGKLRRPRKAIHSESNGEYCSLALSNEQRARSKSAQVQTELFMLSGV